MNITIAKQLAELTSDFYAHEAASFSATRSSAWKGWELLVQDLHASGLGRQDRLRILDAACGNLRFEQFISGELPHASIHALTVDNCDPLVQGAADLPEHCSIQHTSCDIIDRLLANVSPLPGAVYSHPVDLAVSFGFLHHIPGQEARSLFIQELISATRPQGFVVLSFWQFMHSEKLAQKARISHEQGLSYAGLKSESLEPGDYLLSWQHAQDVYRYCHHFSDDEITHLITGFSDRVDLVHRYKADGKSQDLNSYVLLRVKP